MHLTGLFHYPVKSLRGVALSTGEVDALGLVGDRRFMLVDSNHRFLTQRVLPRMALIATSLSATELALAAEGAGQVSVARGAQPDAPRKVVTVWSSEGLVAEDCGDAAAQWLSDFLRAQCRLVRIGPDFHRPVLKPGKARPGDVTTFSDAYPMLVVSEASVADLNDRLLERGEEPVPMSRFRPNLVVSGCGPFAEDTWTHFRIGDVVFRSGGPCARCPIITTDQLTGERGHEPLRTLATYRRDPADPTNVHFGQNLFHETKSGFLRVGDEVVLL